VKFDELWTLRDFPKQTAGMLKMAGGSDFFNEQKPIISRVIPIKTHHC